ncbi:MAG: MBL fold metallo-hydrolase [Clostridiales bacterium]|nr:MBL fold metallo-hydrolase [Clostridiales bacterium]
MVNMKAKNLRVLVLSLVMAFCAIALVFINVMPTKANAETSTVFEMVDGTSAKLNDDGGIRWKVRMDEATKNNIVDNDNVTLEFIITYDTFFDRITDDTYYQTLSVGNRAYIVQADETKIYQLDGSYYANVCLTKLKANEYTQNYVAIATIVTKVDAETSTYEYAKVADKTIADSAFSMNRVKSNLYALLNMVVLDTNTDYTSDVSNCPAYNTWFGTESYPVKVNTTKRYEQFATNVNNGVSYGSMRIEIAQGISADSSVTLNGELPTNAGLVVPSNMQVHLIAQASLGDSYLIQVDGKNVLIDAGQDAYSDPIVTFLNNKGITTIDYLLITHPHEDHTGGLDKIVNNFTVNEAWYYPIDFTLAQEGDFEAGKEQLEEFLALCQTKNIPLNVPTAEGQELVVSENLTIKMYNLEILQSQEQNDNVNSLGIIYLAEYYGKKVLFPGDTFSDGDALTALGANAPSSQPVLDKIGDVDIFMAQHHGGTGCVNTFSALEALTPDYVLMSFPAPRDSSNGWYKLAVPTITRCNKLGIPCYSTGQSGDITVTISETGKIDLTSSKEASSLTRMAPIFNVTEVVDYGENFNHTLRCIKVTFSAPLTTVSGSYVEYDYSGILFNSQDVSEYIQYWDATTNQLVIFLPIDTYNKASVLTFTTDFVSETGLRLASNVSYIVDKSTSTWSLYQGDIPTELDTFPAPLVEVSANADSASGAYYDVKIYFNTTLAYTDSLLFTEENDYGIKINGKTITSVVNQYGVIWGKTTYLVPENDHYTFYIAKDQFDDDKGLVITIEKDTTLIEGGLLSDVNLKWATNELSDFINPSFNYTKFETYTGDFSEFTATQYEVIQDISGNATSATNRYYQVYITIPYGISKSANETLFLTEENNGYGVKVNGKLITSNSTTVTWGETTYIVAGATYYTFYITKTQIDDANGVVVTIEKDSPLLTTGLKADVSMKLTANASTYFGSCQAYEKYTGNFSEFTDENGRVEMSFDTNIYAEKHYDSADGNLYYILHWTVSNMTMSGQYSNSQLSELGLKINNQPFYNVDEPVTWLTTTYTGLESEGTVFTIAIPAANIPNADIGVVITFPAGFPFFESEEYKYSGGSFYVSTETFRNDLPYETVWIRSYTGDFSEFPVA